MDTFATLLPILDACAAESLLERKALRMAKIEQIVAPMLEDIRRRGDEAVCEYCRRFDGFDSPSLLVSSAELEQAASQLAPAFRDAILVASQNIREYAAEQLPRAWMREYSAGRRLGQIVRPLASIGAYIPAGRYPLPSTLLMTVIPAQVAGVPVICVACPRPSVEILGAAHLLGVTRVFRIGGAQAIGALAFGTATVPKVDRIAGPGNIYVAAAKKLVAGETGIDFAAGPTEIVIIAAEADPRHLAADLLAQAEHDIEASSILLTPSRALAEATAREIERQIETLPTAAVARASICTHGACLLTHSLEEAVDISNRLAPEHLSLYHPELLPGIQNAGSVFLGPFSPEAAGDYASGPNHVLPTAGAARLRGGLSAADFVKVISIQELTAGALALLAPSITTLARAEGLEAHARSVEVRLGL
ncbi:MAG TPA: histidinol dehydrogenase [Bryobacteraceae bacterium]|jgi:histidinol dehydrogenase|nr:histidinol dehydrogenase [Bryobacteraceae bacterium]